MMKNTKLILLTIASLFIASAAKSQEEKDVKKVFVCEIQEDKNITFLEAKNYAIQNARMKAAEESFGVRTIVDREIIDNVKNGLSDEAYMEIISESLAGEWIWDNKEPQVDIDYDSEQRRFNYQVLLNGKVRKKPAADTQLKWSLLTSDNDADSSTETNVVNGKKRIYVKFKSPVDGYVAIYWRGSDDKFTCMLPYKRSSGDAFFVRANKEYTFFDRSSDPTATPLAIVPDVEAEINAMYVIFSPNGFTKPMEEDNGRTQLNSVKSKDFKQWLYKNKTTDNRMTEQHKWFKIVR